MKKSRNLFLILIFMMVILLFGGITILKTPNTISLTENRSLQVFEKPTFDTLVSGQFQKTFDKAFIDQIYGRNHFFTIYKEFVNTLKRPIISLLNTNDDMTLVSISDNGIFKVGVNGEYLVEFPFQESSEYDRLFEQRVNNYNTIHELYPDINLYAYKVTNARDTSWFDEANELYSIGEMLSDKFINRVGSSLKYGQSEYENWDEYQNYNYKTDHHWNSEGAKLGYENIIELINQDFPEIGEAKKPKDKFCSTAKFYGSLIKQSNFNMPNNIYDTICEYQYDLGDYEVFVNDKHVPEFGNRKAYYNNDYDDTKGVNHYAKMFGVDTAKVVYDFGENTGINALIISDSYTNAIKPVLSSHFDKTTFIDFRHYVDVYGDMFNLKKFVEKEKIDLIIYIGGLFTIYLDEPYNIVYY